MAITRSTVEETLFIPLWCRAQVSTRYPSLLHDPKAIALVGAIDYDFSVIDARLSPEFRLTSAARDRQCDEAVRAYLADHPRASVISLGAGLDTAFYRVDNGLITWHDLDLPNVIAVRRQLLPAPDRVHAIARSLFDASWCDELTHTEEGVFAVAGAVLGYFDEARVKTFFSTLADALPGAEMVFSSCSRRAASLINAFLRRTGMANAAIGWTMEGTDDLSRWEEALTVVDRFSFFRGIPLDPAWGEATLRRIRAIDAQELMSIVHVRV